MPEVFERHEHLRSLGDILLAADGDEARAKHLGRIFEAALQLWAKGQLAGPDVEPWDDFRTRAKRALGTVRDGIPDPGLAMRQRGRKIVVFTSAGMIAAAVQLAIGCPDEQAVSLAFRTRNASLSELLFSGERLSLLSFNGVPHLRDASLISLR
jgi:broad specificity phosphatase PhoE